MDIRTDSRFRGLQPFANRVWLSSPTMHGDEQHWVDDAIATNWVSTVGRNIDEAEKNIAEIVGVKYAVGLASGTAALHLATKLAGERLYGRAKPSAGTLAGHKVFCSDVTFDASINPVAYEDGEAVFIDTERDTWNMDPEALKEAFRRYPDVKLIALAHLYGTPGKMEEIREIADAHGALIVEDAAESLGALYKMKGRWVETGAIGDYNCISFNGNKIITGSSGGMFLTDSKEDADKVRKWSTQSREPAPWYQHEEIGYNYRMSNISFPEGAYRTEEGDLRAVPGRTQRPAGEDESLRREEIHAELLAVLHPDRRKGHGSPQPGRPGREVDARKGKEQPGRDPGSACCFPGRRTADLEAHAYAADLPGPCVCGKERRRRGPVQAGPLPAERQQNDAGRAGHNH